MRRVALTSVALAACGLLVLSAGAQETASSTPTIDQSLEWKAAFNPKISPDGMRVVYEIQKTNWEENAFERNLWIADIPEGESHALTSAKKSSTNAAWSPDGKWIAFLSDRPGQITGTPDGKQQLYVISADGGEAQQLTKVENDVNALEWAPDSKRIAFSMTDPEPKALKDRKEKYGDYSVVGPLRFPAVARLWQSRSGLRTALNSAWGSFRGRRTERASRLARREIRT